MKKLVLFAMVIAVLGIFNACEKSDDLIDQNIDAQSLDAAKTDVYSENGYLAFKSIETVDSIIHMLSEMTSDEKQIWEKSMNFISARSEYEMLFDKYEKLSSYEEFLAFKNKNSEKLVFNELDAEDCSIDYPFCTTYFLPVLNNGGLVKIGRSLIKYTKEDHIVIKNGDIAALDNLESKTDDDNIFVYPKLKSTYTVSSLIHNFPEDDPKGRNNRWHEMDGHSKRRLLNELKVDRYRYDFYNYSTNQLEWVRGNKVYLKQRGQKKSWGSWNDYKTKYSFDNVKVKIDSQPTAVYNPYSPVLSLEVRPSASVWLADIQVVTPDQGTTPPLLPIPSISLDMYTSFRGFSYDQYQIDYIVHSGFPGTTMMGSPSYFY